MLPLLFTLFVTGLGAFISAHFSEQITWFSYYVGGIVGLLFASVILDFLNKRKRKRLERIEEQKRPGMSYAANK